MHLTFARTRSLVLLPLALATMAFGGCSDAARPAGTADLARSDAPRVEADPQSLPGTTTALEAFTADLYAVLSRKDGNLVFSPYSAAVALAMTRAGAVGETARQMDEVLHAALAGDLDAGFNAIEEALSERSGEYPLGSGEDGEETAELVLATANQLWAQRDFEFEAAFLDRLASHYGSGVRLVDYVDAREEARTAINEWVSERTRERIPELIPDGVLDDLTRLVLTNAVYLNAPWLHRFDVDATTPGPFTRLDGSEIEAQMMRLSARLRAADVDGIGGYQAVELPYVDGSLSMAVIVPDEGTFEAFQSGLDAARLGQALGRLGDAQVNLALPRFEFRSQAMLKDALSELGMPIAFTDEADFSGMSPLGDDLLIQEVVHEAFIAVDEQGTEAAAATAVVMGLASAPSMTVDLTVDRPFLFVIQDTETGAILFMGRVLDPIAG